MTTIAANHARMVSDSQVTMEGGNGDRVYQAQKIIRFKGDLIGCAGSNQQIEAFLAWYGTKKKKPQFPKDVDFEALILTSKGDLFAYDETLSRDKLVGDFYAIGSGGSAALGALYAGASLEQAVTIATRIDPYSGLPIQTLDLADNN